MEIEPEETFDSGKAKFEKGAILLCKVRVREVVDSKVRGVEYVVEGVDDSKHIYIGRIPEGDCMLVESVLKMEDVIGVETKRETT